MNYQESKNILDEVKKADKILLNCHRSPDPDSIGSALAMREVLIDLGKEVEIICPTEVLYKNIDYLKGFDQIKGEVDFSKFNYSDFDLFIVLDSASWDMVGYKNDKNPDVKVALIDHHHTNPGYADINLIDKTATSVGEMLYAVFKDWEVEITKDIADSLMAGIVGDTGAFRYPNLKKEIFIAVADLMDKGADKDKAITKIYRSDPYNLVKFYGEVLSRMKIDEKRKFVWSAVPYEVYSKLDKPVTAKESSASLFTQVVEGTDFGFVAVETEPKKLSISFRSRTGFDTSVIATALGGGGHVYASGGKVEDLEFGEAVEKVIKTVEDIVDGNYEKDK